MGAMNATFGKHVARAAATSAACAAGIAVLDLPKVGAAFDYIVTMEDLADGQRIANYTVEFQRDGSDTWEILVPAVQKKSTLGDRPDGHDPRDQYIGHKRIDVPEWPDDEAAGR